MLCDLNAGELLIGSLGATLIRLGFQNNPKPSFVKPIDFDDVCINVTISG